MSIISSPSFHGFIEPATITRPAPSCTQGRALSSGSLNNLDPISRLCMCLWCVSQSLWMFLETLPGSWVSLHIYITISQLNETCILFIGHL